MSNLPALLFNFSKHCWKLSVVVQVWQRDFVQVVGFQFLQLVLVIIIYRGIRFYGKGYTILYLQGNQNHSNTNNKATKSVQNGKQQNRNFSLSSPGSDKSISLPYKYTFYMYIQHKQFVYLKQFPKEEISKIAQQHRPQTVRVFPSTSNLYNENKCLLFCYFISSKRITTCKIKGQNLKFSAGHEMINATYIFDSPEYMCSSEARS